MSLLSDISTRLETVGWENKAGNGKSEINEIPLHSDLFVLYDLPMYEELVQLAEKKPGIWKHVCGVIANINELVSDTEAFQLGSSGDNDYDERVRGDLRMLRNFCLKPQTAHNVNTAIQNQEGAQFAKDFLRVAALYHDIGKIISPDRHVSRGVHLMRDVNDDYRTAFEQGLMGGGFEDKHNFWTLLSHHDIFGVLCTGEASLAALSQMVTWSGEYDLLEYYKCPAALMSYLLILNLADADSTLRFGSPLNGLRTVEARRYLKDWKTVKEMLWNDELNRPKNITREDFVESLLSRTVHPERTIERITRIVTTSYRMKLSNQMEASDDLLLDESEVKKLVEDELDMLHGAKFRLFCDLFARFCKIDYGRRFFDVIMLFELLDIQHGLLKLSSGVPGYKYPTEKNYDKVKELDPADEKKRRGACLKEMTCRICSILKRFIDDYGESVRGDPHSAPLMCIVMANLMPENRTETAWAICRALKEHESHALSWISEEVSVSPYGG